MAVPGQAYDALHVVECRESGKEQVLLAVWKVQPKQHVVNLFFPRENTAVKLWVQTKSDWKKKRK